MKLFVMLGIVVFLCISSPKALAQQADSLEKSFLQYEAQLYSAVNNADKQLLLQAQTGFQKLADHKEQAMLARYYIGYADYRLSSIFEDMNEDQKRTYLDSAIKNLQTVTEMAPDFAEGWALLGNCYGMKATGVFSAVRYGPKSEDAINRALELAPQNPRVVMMNGISLMHKPGMFGGSVEKAINEFKEAAELFKEYDPPSNLHPDWGTAENYAWMAQAYIQQGELQQAKLAYQSALHIDPDYYWVQDVLLPELKQEMN